MPPKQKVAAPIDRPLSRAYLREFSGWSTAYPPGLSEPTSLREMENVQVNRDGSLRVRPGLRYLSYSETPGEGTGLALDLDLVGTHEPFYLEDGSKAYLFAVREVDLTVGFRVLAPNGDASALLTLTEAGFEQLQPDSLLNFTAGTTYVKYLQIDNKVFALSDNGESMRLFGVGSRKFAKTLLPINVPQWDSADKLTVLHPEATWINGREPDSTRQNRMKNPSFETSLDEWETDDYTDPDRLVPSGFSPISGERIARLETRPQRTNLATQPLYDVATLGLDGWTSGEGDPDLTVSTSWMRVGMGASKGEYYAYSKKYSGVADTRSYKVAFDFEAGAHVTVRCKVRFFGSNGSQVGETVVQDVTGSGRWASPSISAPDNATSMRVWLGGKNEQADATNVKFKNLVVCRHSEATGMFHGDSGTNYFWLGGANDSASVYHPSNTVVLKSIAAAVPASKDLAGSLYVRSNSTTRDATMLLQVYDKDGVLIQEASSATGATSVSGAWTRLSASLTTTAAAVSARLKLSLPGVLREEYHYVDAALLEPDTLTADAYFDGSTANAALTDHSWKGEEHASTSVEKIYLATAAIPTAETATADTLRATGGRTGNPYTFGFFFTFNNEVGESAASMISLLRVSRPWSGWVWETPNLAGEPSGTSTDIASKACDQLVAIMPEAVFDEAVLAGATGWSLYVFSWSDQDPVPVVALKAVETPLPTGATYEEKGWARVTPQLPDLTDEAVLPSEENRVNFTDPSHGAQGLVAADRMILVNDPTAAAVIRWTSNLTGEYTNFSSSRGGGYKTLTSGNLYIPAVVKLWQNPQSVDTLTILCLGTDGHSTSYYMAPGQVTSQSDATSFMAFEETTATPGTTSPYGVEVLNNALYHPLDDMLMKSTASNYNISHKSMTEMIANRWSELRDKIWMISSQLDNRLYYLVHNPRGEVLEEGCKGNELWVYDTAAGESGTWSRFLIQAHSLRKIEFGGRIYMSVLRPDGIYYLDPLYGRDDYVDSDLLIQSRPIPWRFETNTQGANRAHDAWAHLQQVNMVLGNFQGSMRWGVKSWDLHGRAVDVAKQFTDTNAPPEDGLPWDIEDRLLVQRDVMEWRLYAESIADVESSGQVSLVQYRYTPVSVNVGYEYGSIETFEYSRNVAVGNDARAFNGIPNPAVDTRRP